jgi:uncharacterized protein (DUF1330 family)
MKKSTAVVLAGLIGVGMGAAGTGALYAAANPPVYMVADNTITDPAKYKSEYLPLAQAAIKAHGGVYVAAGTGTAIDGEPPHGRVVILKWDSLEQVKKWRYSPEYVKAREIGEKYAKFRTFAVDGVAQ